MRQKQKIQTWNFNISYNLELATWRSCLLSFLNRSICDFVHEIQIDHLNLSLVAIAYNHIINSASCWKCWRGRKKAVPSSCSDKAVFFREESWCCINAVGNFWRLGTTGCYTFLLTLICSAIFILLFCYFHRFCFEIISLSSGTNEKPYVISWKHISKFIKNYRYKTPSSRQQICLLKNWK